jgi:hypothetical protein
VVLRKRNVVHETNRGRARGSDDHGRRKKEAMQQSTPRYTNSSALVEGKWSTATNFLYSSTCP